MWKSLFKPRVAKEPAPPGVNQAEEHVASVAGKVDVDAKTAQNDHGEVHKTADDDAMFVLANFTGLLILQGATEKRQIRYVMEIVCPAAGQKFECVKRFNQFGDLRQRVLDLLKQCRSKRCSKCSAVAASIYAQPFPGRRLFTTLVHVRERAVPLEAFLQCVLDAALTWKGCKRSKHAFNEVASQFVGAPVDGMFSSSERPSLDFRKSIRHLMVERQVSIGESVADTSDTSVPPAIERETPIPQDSFEEEEHKEGEDEEHPATPEHPTIPTDTATHATTADTDEVPAQPVATDADDERIEIS